MKFTIDRKNTTIEAEPVVKEAIDIFKGYLKTYEMNLKDCIEWYDDTFGFVEDVFDTKVTAQCLFYYGTPRVTDVVFTVDMLIRRDFYTISEVSFSLKLVDTEMEDMSYDLDKKTDTLFVRDYKAV